MVGGRADGVGSGTVTGEYSVAGRNSRVEAGGASSRWCCGMGSILATEGREEAIATVGAEALGVVASASAD